MADIECGVVSVATAAAVQIRLSDCEVASTK